ncbi:OCIA domain-containing protein 1-like [Sardina pilchardus]|uniref:OCIA domain-containing protein 1-like n=1 Tax=Sardina pilchardus TaxID=27697 RepID=UPI002E0FFB90
MSQASSSFTDDSQENVAQRPPVSLDYVPTEEETRVFKECNQESFWYRSAPISVISMAVTQALVTRGALTSSSRFGSLPKVVFAGICGYLGGKVSYMKTCQEKFKNLPNSPLGEAIRQRQRHVPLQFPQDQSEFVDPNKSTSEPMFQTERTSQSDFSYSEPEASYQYEEDPKRPDVRYEELRSRNRENYESTLTQRADALLKPPSGSPTVKKEGKKNLYGDDWEE